MSEFSKQYSEAVGLGFHDFDLMEHFNKCEDGYYVSCICEGFGSLAVMNEGGICKLALMDKSEEYTAENGTPVIWVPIDEVIEKVKANKLS